MARTPHQFGVPNVELNLDSEPSGYRQSGLFEAQTVNIARQQAYTRAVAAAREHATERARNLIRIRAQWDRDFSFGSVVKPENDTLRGYKQILRQGGGTRNVQFSPTDYHIFDGIIVKQAGLDPVTKKSLCPAFNTEHPHYDDYAALRRNIAILRNYLLVTLLPNGKGKTKEDGENFVAVQQMAAKLGKALGKKSPFLTRWKNSAGKYLLGKDLSTPDTNPFLEAANIPDLGIATMYNYLFDRRDVPVSLFPNPVEYLTSKPWNLIPIDQTPFSDENMMNYSKATTMEGIANAFEGVVAQLHSVDALTESDKKISVDEARNILENLRVIIGNRQEETNVDVIEDSKHYEAEMLLRAALAFKDAMASLKKVDPNLFHDPTFMDARDALSEIDYLIKMEALDAMTIEGRADTARTMSKRLSAMPKRSKPQGINSLITRVRNGLNQAAARQSSMSMSGPARVVLSPAQQAVQSSTTSFTPGLRVRQISNPALMLFAQHINDHTHDHDHDHAHDAHPDHATDLHGLPPLPPGSGGPSRG